MRRLRSLFLILVALCLPVQVALAAAMPLCRHAQAVPAAEAAAQADEMHCHEAAMETAATDTAAHDSALGCDNCEVCHLASAGFLPAGDSAAAAPMVDVFVARCVAVTRSFIADPPEQPPRR